MKSGKDRVKDTAKENRKGLSTATCSVRCDSHREVRNSRQKVLIGEVLESSLTPSRADDRTGKLKVTCEVVDNERLY